MDYIEICIEISSFSEDFAEIVIAAMEGVSFESFLSEEPCLKAYIPKNSFDSHIFEEALSELRSLSLFDISVTSSAIRSQNWNAFWESNFEPIIIAGECTIKASFHKDLPRNRYNITIDPKMAFGTGHHQTTSLMVEAILSSNVKGKRVLDMGCGTGILAILAAKMGAVAPVHAIDIDHIAADSAKENSRKNRLRGKIEVATGDSSAIKAKSYDLILANINRNIILKDIEIYANGLLPEGVLILSGFYMVDNGLIVEEARKYNLKLIEEREKDEWSALKFCIDKYF